MNKKTKGTVLAQKAYKKPAENRGESRWKAGKSKGKEFSSPLLPGSASKEFTQLHNREPQETSLGIGLI